MVRVRYSFSSRRTGHTENISKQREKFPKIVRDVIKISDIILEVLDARFIKETRNIELENLIKAQGKKLIYVLNKSDLIDINYVKKKLELIELYPYVFVSCLDRRGAGDLREKIKMEVKRLHTEYGRAQIGVIGYPNTGKSSLINLLIGRASAKTAAESGFTKGIQKIKLTNNILILDTPGVIPEKEDSAKNIVNLAEHAKISVRTYDKVKEPEFIVYVIINKYPGVLEKFYSIDAKGETEILIEQLGRKKHWLKKGNQVDADKTSRFILKDWQKGRIKI